MFDKARMLVGTLLAWVGFRIMPAPMSDIAALMSIPMEILNAMERGRTFGVVTIPWGELEPSKRMSDAATDALRQERHYIESEIRLRESGEK